MRNVAVTLRGLGVRTYLFRSLQSDTAISRWPATVESDRSADLSKLQHRLQAGNHPISSVASALTGRPALRAFLSAPKQNFDCRQQGQVSSTLQIRFRRGSIHKTPQ